RRVWSDLVGQPGDDLQVRLHQEKGHHGRAERPRVAHTREGRYPLRRVDAIAKEPGSVTQRKRRSVGIGGAVAVEHAGHARQWNHDTDSASQHTAEDRSTWKDSAR